MKDKYARLAIGHHRGRPEVGGGVSSVSSYARVLRLIVIPGY